MSATHGERRTHNIKANPPKVKLAIRPRCIYTYSRAIAGRCPVQAYVRNVDKIRVIARGDLLWNQFGAALQGDRLRRRQSIVL